MAKQKHAIVKWDEKLAELAGRATKAVAGVGGGSMIGTKGGILTYKGAAMPDNQMNVIILCDIPHNTYYSGGFDPDNPGAPVCYALGDPDNPDAPMAPHADSSEPQAEECTGCLQNEWGSADRGRGKACGNKHRLALITEGDLEDVAAAEVVFLHIPPTSVKGWAGYVRKLEQTLQKPPLAFITTVSAHPSEKGGFTIMFSEPQEVEDNDVLGALIEKAELVKKDIVTVSYVQIAEQPARRAAPPLRNIKKVAPPVVRGKASSPLVAAGRKPKFTR